VKTDENPFSGSRIFASDKHDEIGRLIFASFLANAQQKRV
jgi:hypothetical protein